MREIGGSERESLKPIYAALYEALFTDIYMWAMVEPAGEIARSAGCIHASLHRIIIQHVDQILAEANAEVRKRALEYGVEEDEVPGEIQNLIQSVSRAAGRNLQPVAYRWQCRVHRIENQA
jgi:hypothetical protein